MAYKYKYRKRNYLKNPRKSKLILEMLALAEKNLNDYEKWSQEAKKWEESRYKIITPFRTKIKEILDNANSYLYLFGIIKTQKLNKEAKKRINELEAEQNIELKQFEKQQPFVRKFSHLSNRNDYLNEIRNLRMELTVAKGKEDLQKNKREKHETMKAIVAKEAKKSRNLANSVKKQLLKLEFCPYCNKTLGQTPHADHIYPISKGGLSTDRNMVYICASCNSNKRDKTLQEFIRIRGLNREKIESNLMLLKKEF